MLLFIIIFIWNPNPTKETLAANKFVATTFLHRQPPQVIASFRKPSGRVFSVFRHIVSPCSSIDDEAASVVVSLHLLRRLFFVNR